MEGLKEFPLNIKFEDIDMFEEVYSEEGEALLKI